jgi:hypothetical protein
MARTTKIVCDVCRKETTKIAAKMNYIPTIPGVSTAKHSNYSHTLDVGICCADRVLKLFNFRKRMTFKQYTEKRRAAV